ncbi:MAG: ribonuclease P protein component [Terrisporobacter sp.]|uniref:ribonuclease P protein component n=1 Tax=Terrisporobacter sp. TaxID=1965305 RepID=UPI002FC96A30
MNFNETQGLKKDSDFRKVYRHGKSLANKYLVMYVLNNKSDINRVGISVSKKVGKANVRNKARRRIKESYRLSIDSKIKKGYDIVFIARVAIKDVDYIDIEKAMKHLVKKSNLF